MRIVAILFILLFTQCCSNKVGKNEIIANEKSIEINKNYMFCMCMGQMYLKYKTNFTVMDGSSEIYFINDSLVIDAEEGRTFIKNYLDSIDKNDLYRSYTNNSLATAKCLDFYNSKKLKKFINKKIQKSK